MHTGFIAGLFERDLPIDLLWNRVNISEACVRPQKYRAPSWSWASINSKTENRITHALRAPDDVTIEILPRPDQKPPSIQARIGLAPTGLQIRAWTTKVDLRNTGLQRELDGQQWNIPPGSITHNFDAIEPERDPPPDVVLVEIYWFPPSPGRGRGDKISGIIAQKEAQERYRHISYFGMRIPSFSPSRAPFGGRATRKQEPRRQAVRDSLQSKLILLP